MMQFGMCPRCQLTISDERQRSTPIICDNCGFVLSHSDEDARAQIDRTFIYVAVTFGAFLVAGFMQVSKWDGAALQVIPLQIKALIGMSSIPDMEQMASICMDRKKYDCVEENYEKIASRDQTKLLRLGKFQMSRARYQQAVDTYRTFFQNKGVDLEASYNFARALGQVGQVDEAAKYYDYVLGAKPDVLQVTVIQSYVKLLMDANRLDQAKRLIEDVRRKSSESAYFMDEDFKKIQERSGAKS